MSSALHNISWLPMAMGLASFLFKADVGPRPTELYHIQECAVPASFSANERSPAPPSDFVVGVNGNFQWVINGAVNPTLTLERGHTYTFDLTAFGDAHPFLINSNANNPFGTIYAGPADGTVLTFTPGNTWPSTIHYHCSVHYGSMVGIINLPGGSVCAGDLNADLTVNSTDFGLFVAAFGQGCASCPEDLNHDNMVNSTDFGLFVSVFGTVCD